MNVSKRTFNPLLAKSFRFSQSENADLIYQGGWAATIQPGTISDSTWTVESGSVTITNKSNTTTTTTAQIAGEVGESIIVNKVTLADGQADERKILLKITANDTPVINDDYGRC